MDVTDAVFHAARFWLNVAALVNMEFIKRTLAVFQAARFWLNAVASPNV